MPDISSETSLTDTSNEAFKVEEKPVPVFEFKVLTDEPEDEFATSERAALGWTSLD